MRNCGVIKAVVLLPFINMFIEKQWRKPSWLWHLLTWPFECLFARVSQHLQARAQLQAQAPAIPIIVVGNITVGGAGKSPVVQQLAIALAQKELRVGVLLRGYRGQHHHHPCVVKPSDSPVSMGDEAVMHAQAFEAAAVAVMVVIDPQRVRGAYYLAEQGVDVVVCDDGLQHYALARDCEVVVFNQPGALHLLPRGPLREPLRRLASVDMILTQQLWSPDFMKQFEYLEAVESHTWFYSTVATTPAAVFAQALTPFLQTGIAIVAIAGIARPERFFKGLTSMGFQVQPLIFADHYQFSLKDLQDFVDIGLPVVMTAKDQVKIQYLVNELVNGAGANAQPPIWLSQLYQRAYVVPFAAELDEALVAFAWQQAQQGCAARLAAR